MELNASELVVGAAGLLLERSAGDDIEEQKRVSKRRLFMLQPFIQFEQLTTQLLADELYAAEDVGKFQDAGRPVLRQAEEAQVYRQNVLLL